MDAMTGMQLNESRRQCTMLIIYDVAERLESTGKRGGRAALSEGTRAEHQAERRKFECYH